MNFTQMLSAIVGVLALFLLIYGACVRSRTVALIGVALAIAGGLLVYYAWWGAMPISA
ncbi:MAG TPA: hypothetical protein IAA64_10610 [Candidatus Ornithocaccomicrobium faecavium]|uniref:Uncharacterized protein n=2 Tax=Clostridia incertae sedis TaxID=189325 RepID=A0A9D1FZB7_9FIRM|nr:hypothetical protein [Clostridiales bacterium]HIS91913.1 hypothetical protein [Candidatus Alectryocaccomicrobium excrementavium]HIV28415.1 hypothetical protein [Candidatus Ornithocaccomicrobium faecavium]